MASISSSLQNATEEPLRNVSHNICHFVGLDFRHNIGPLSRARPDHHLLGRPPGLGHDDPGPQMLHGRAGEICSHSCQSRGFGPCFFRFFSAPSPSTSTLEIQVKVSLRRLANRDKEYETSASGRRSAGIMSALSRKSTQVGPQNAIVIDEAVRITPVEQSTASAAVAASDDSPTPTTKERPRSNILKDT